MYPKRLSGIGLLVSLAFLYFLFLAPNLVKAVTFPTGWTLLGFDDNENGTSDDRRDVGNISINTNFNTSYLFLQMATQESPGWPNGASREDNRYKWFFDLDNDLTLQGGNIENSEFLLFVEDGLNADNTTGKGDGVGEIYFLNDTNNDGLYNEYEPNNYYYRRVLNETVAGFRIFNGKMEMYILRSKINASSLKNLCVAWATDQENPNLIQAPTQDRSDNTLCFTIPKVAIDKLVNDTGNIVALPGAVVNYTIKVANTGSSILNPVKVVDVMPSGLIFISSNPPNSSSVSNGIILNLTWNNIGPLNPGEVFNISILMKIPQSSSDNLLTNYGWVYANYSSFGTLVASDEAYVNVRVPTTTTTTSSIPTTSTSTSTTTTVPTTTSTTTSSTTSSTTTSSTTTTTSQPTTTTSSSTTTTTVPVTSTTSTAPTTSTTTTVPVTTTTTIPETTSTTTTALTTTTAITTVTTTTIPAVPAPALSLPVQAIMMVTLLAIALVRMKSVF